MESPLSFNATERFRKSLLIRNLPPYEDFKHEDLPGQSELIINDVGVMDPGNVEDIGNENERKHFVKNKYGPDGRTDYGETKDVNILLQTESNDGEYQYLSSEPSRDNDQSLKRLYLLNWYGPSEGFGEYGPVNIEYINNIIEKRDIYYRFIASSYNLFNLFTLEDPEGNNGLLSQDSELAKIAASELKAGFQYRISEETYQQTLGRVNVLDALSDPFDALAIVSGREEVIESNWKISVPDNIIGKGLDFISRITGVYSPYSWIPGDYFGPEERKSYVNQIINGVFKNRNKKNFSGNKNSSEVFLANTGQGQSNRLFKTLELNKFRPDYRANFITDLNLKAPDGNHYVGSRSKDIKELVSPISELPQNEDGVSVESPVRGYSEVSKAYENPEGTNNFMFGLGGVSYYNNKTNLSGGLVWVSEKREPDAGTFGGRGGKALSSSIYYDPLIFERTKSTQYDFTEGSILYDTQKLVESADRENLGGVRRLQHVGNAISQISKVFHDGTREITKGSAVFKIENEFGESGTEYCRLFTKDTPYVLNNDLQKSTGMETENRAFSYSVLSNTYNLNIAPTRGNDSTNIQNEEVKKYMFSLENLAWRTSSKKGFTYQDLPHCERGPNKGRIMWFPPYDIKVSEQNSVNWTTNEFLGRTEPIYTYGNTQRQGNLSWKIVVDHPSILNAIVDKELKGMDTEKVNEIVDSFFAGCKDYDIYKLAEKYPQFKPSDIYDIIQKIEEEKEIEEYTEEIPRYRTYETEPTLIEYVNTLNDDDWNFSFYFHHDVPGPQNQDKFEANPDYESNIGEYLSLRESYLGYNLDETEKTKVNNFFDENLVNTLSKSESLAKKIGTVIDNGGRLKIKLRATTSSPAPVGYNASLARRRMDSVLKYLLSLSISESNDSNKTIESIQDKIDFDLEYTGEEGITVTNSGYEVDCHAELEGNAQKYSIDAMACRRVQIMDVEEIGHEPKVPDDFVPEEITERVGTDLEIRKRENITTKTTSELKRKEDVAKIIVRKLLSECDYFNHIKENTPFVYDGIKEKIKYFQPTFHSTTPEGLNSRLTFLQQCIRPGDTIPVIGDDGKPRSEDALNTAFGAPPICVLRIGDFYHTKIAINQLSINYEPLQFDLNPEGIGVQPMIADVNISFYFIGGQGLKAPVARLQNALSFNYYANTEVYDERAEATEDRKTKDEEVWRRIEENSKFSLLGPSDEGNQNQGDTIGVIQETTILDSTFSGNTSFNKVVSDLVSSVSTYTSDTNKMLDSLVTNNSEIALYYYLFDRRYKYGQIHNYYDQANAETTEIIGKPVKIEERVEKLFYDILYDIEAETNPLLVDIENETYDLTRRDIKKFKKRLLNLCPSYRDKLINDINEFNTSLIGSQISMIEYIDKLNFVTSKTDGYRTKNGNVVIYDLSGTTTDSGDTYTELLNDLTIISDDLKNYLLRLYNDVDSSQPTILDSYRMNSGNFYNNFLTGNYNTEEHTRLCTLLFSDMVSDPEALKNNLLGEELKDKPEWILYMNQLFYGQPMVPAGLNYILGKEETELMFNTSGMLRKYLDLKDSGINKVKEFKNSDSVSKFESYEPFDITKERIFDYIQQEESNSDQVNMFEITYSEVNAGSASTFNHKVSFN